VTAEVRRHDAIAYREEGPPDGPAALLLHGYPESSYMWRDVLPALAESGWRAIAPDLPGYGDSPPDPPGTWERHVEAVERFRQGLGLDRLALVVHDWGGLIGLRWACDHPDAVGALVISDTGFFPDGRWHGMAKMLRTEGQGEQLMEGLNREGFGGVMRQASDGIDEEAIDEYWKAYADEERRRCHLDLYRSGDFEKLEPYEGKLAALGVPALVIWGEDDEFAPVGGAYRFKKEMPSARLVVIPGAGHFLPEDEPQRVANEIAAFLDERAS
jgi:haloalkane dehalogenase